MNPYVSIGGIRAEQPRRDGAACGSLHVWPATLTHRTVSSATGLDGVDVIKYEIIYEMCFLVSIFSAHSNALIEVCCQGKTCP